MPIETASPGQAAVGSQDDDKARDERIFNQAKQFDAYLRGELEEAEKDTLRNDCLSNTGQNPFCFSVIHEEEFEKQQRAQKTTARVDRHRRHGVIHARFDARKHLLNWRELQRAPLSALVKGFSHLKLEELRQIERAAFNETDCPNNPAVATAASLESYLPDGSPMDAIGRLYEKGGTCYTDSGADQEQVLTRAGLFYFAVGDFSSAIKVLTLSSQIKEAFAARALYWLYRSRSEMGDEAHARQALEELQARYPFSFHTLVALTAAHQDPGQILLRSAPHEAKRSQQVGPINTLIEEVEILHHFRFNDSATRVLDWAIRESRGVEPEVMIYLAVLKQEQGDHQSKISILSDVLYNHPSLISRETMELYFPKVYFPIFEKHSAQIDPYLLLAIARRESAFDVRAVSPANARGLLQVTPATNRSLGRRVNLFNPDENVEVGTKYILKLLERLDGQIHLALAAYNAGYQHLEAWTERYPFEDSILFIDLIPYRETRDYVASILRNYYWYRRIHQGEEMLRPEQLLELANTKPSH